MAINKHVSVNGMGLLDLGSETIHTPIRISEINGTHTRLYGAQVRLFVNDDQVATFCLDDKSIKLPEPIFADAGDSLAAKLWVPNTPPDPGHLDWELVAELVEPITATAGKAVNTLGSRPATQASSDDLEDEQEPPPP